MSPTLTKVLTATIDRGVKSSVEKAIPSIIKRVLRAVWSNPAYSVVTGGQCLLIEKGLAPEEAWNLSKECLILFLRDEKCKVGDSRFDWSPTAGRDIVQAYQIDHWDN